MRHVLRRSRRVAGLIAVITAFAVLMSVAPAFGQGTSTVTQADCDAGRIKNKQGETLRGEACEKLIGKRVRLAQTGFEAWWLVVGGIVCIGGAAALRMRTRPTPQLG